MYGGKTHVPGKIDQYGFEVLTGDQRQGLADACVEFLKQKQDRPFLLVASFINPHDICYMAINDFERVSPRKRAKAKAGRPGAKKGPADAPHQLALAEAMQPPPGVSEADFFARYLPPLPANLEPPADEPDILTAASHGGRLSRLRICQLGRERMAMASLGLLPADRACGSGDRPVAAGVTRVRPGGKHAGRVLQRPRGPRRRASLGAQVHVL